MMRSEKNIAIVTLVIMLSLICFLNGCSNDSVETRSDSGGYGLSQVAFGMNWFEVLATRIVNGWLRRMSNAALPMSCGKNIPAPPRITVFEFRL